MSALTLYGAEFSDYLARLSADRRGLQNPAVRDGLRQLLAGRDQLALFDATASLDDSLDRILDAQQRREPLYRNFPIHCKPALELEDVLPGSLFGETLHDEVRRFVDSVKAQGEDSPKYTEVTKAIRRKRRNINVAHDALKPFLQQHLLPYLETFPLHKNCHGGPKGWTAKRSLQTHIPMACALTFDLDAAFDNVKPEYIFSLFYGHAASLPYEQRRDVAGWLAMISTAKRDDGRCLPTGATHSLALFNALWYPLDCKVATLAQRRGMRVSRWVDDVIISSPEHRPVGDFAGVLDVVNPYFPVSASKTYFQSTAQGRIFALGHIADADGRVCKNTAAVRILERTPALKPDSVTYSPWE